MIRQFLLAAISIIAFTASVLAKPDNRVLKELTTRPIGALVTQKRKMPPWLQVALAASFQQKTLSLADAGQPFQETDFHASGTADLPSRRLMFAFDIGNYWVVYYEAGGYGLSVNALILSAVSTRKHVLVWGGVERDYDKPAKTPQELVTRIRLGRLLDNKAFSW